ncbi:MAG: M23 family metallopeptidase [Bacteroidetes bacterium]|nr:M23 family metallopeptidase [Bacteroidota bacterium]
MKSFIYLLVISLVLSGNKFPGITEWLLPVNLINRQSLIEIRLTEIGTFGIKRKARPTVPSHLHTGIDIRRPNDRYDDEPVFAASGGTVISVRTDGPFAQVIIEHAGERGNKIWTVYEHLAGISCFPGDWVTSNSKIGRFMNKEELDRYGWKFNHLHFEILKQEPRQLKNDFKNPHRKFGVYNLECYTYENLDKYYFDPFEFYSVVWKNQEVKALSKQP